MRSLADIRRAELRQAAFRVLQRDGVQNTTLEKVAAEAGASKGIVLHYFGTKAALFEHVMREANRILAQRVVGRMQRATSPRERLRAIIEGNFEPDLFTAPICLAWLSLCAEVPRSAELMRIQRIIHARMRSNLLSALRDLMPMAAAQQKAAQISALIDGLWLKQGLAPDSLTCAEAIDLVLDTLPHAETVSPTARTTQSTR